MSDETIGETRQRIQATGLWPWERDGRPLTDCDPEPPMLRGDHPALNSDEAKEARRRAGLYTGTRSRGEG